jgi:hypothetical protein
MQKGKTAREKPDEGQAVRTIIKTYQAQNILTIQGGILWDLF